MTEKNNFLANLAKREPVEEPEPEIREPTPRKKSREGMRHLATWVPEDDWKWLRQEAFDSETTMGALMTEALKLLRSKRDK